MIRNNVSFTCRAEALPSGEEPVVSVDNVRWFSGLLRELPGVVVEPELIQEDWGVVVFLTKDGKRFWVGLSAWFGERDEPSGWLAHFHHRSFLEKLSGSGKIAMKALLADFAAFLKTSSEVSEVRWYREKDMNQPYPPAEDSPF